MALEIILLSEVSQTEKDKHHMILLICISLFFLNDTNELVYKKDQENKQTQKTNLWLPKRKRVGG